MSDRPPSPGFADSEVTPQNPAVARARKHYRATGETADRLRLDQITEEMARNPEAAWGR